MSTSKVIVCYVYILTDRERERESIIIMYVVHCGTVFGMGIYSYLIPSPFTKPKKFLFPFPHSPSPPPCRFLSFFFTLTHSLLHLIPHTLCVVPVLSHQLLFLFNRIPPPSLSSSIYSLLNKIFLGSIVFIICTTFYIYF